MISEHEILTVLDELRSKGSCQFDMLGSVVMAKYFIDSAKLTLSTGVYQGKDYVPESVRECLDQRPPMPPTDIRTFVSLNEKNLQISLNYLGTSRLAHPEQFKGLVEQFCWIAEQWRYFIDDQDKRELVRVPKNP